MSNEREVLATARKVATLQVKCRRLRRNLKQAMKDLRHERKMLKALANLTSDPSVIPSRVFGNGVGTKVVLEKKTKKALLDEEDLV